MVMPNRRRSDAYDYDGDNTIKGKVDGEAVVRIFEKPWFQSPSDEALAQMVVERFKGKSVAREKF